MTPNNFEFPTAFSVWDDAEKEAIERVVRSGKFTAGDEVKALEEEFAAYHGKKHAISVNNGSDANLLMIAALFHKENQPLNRGDRAAVPALAWPTTYAPLIQHGLDLAVIDCDDTWGMSTSIDQEGPPPRMFMFVPVLGNASGHPGYVRSNQPNFSNHDCYFLEDNCESLGARDPNGRLTGTLSLMSSFSFYFSHQMSAIEGGMVLTDDDECARLVRILRDHGLTRTVDPSPDFGHEYNCAFPGYNMRSTEIHAAVAREQLKKLERNIALRWTNHQYFIEKTVGLPITHQRMVGRPSVFGLQFMVADRATRERLAKALRAKSIDCRPPVGGSFTRHPFGAPWRNQPTPMADLIHDTGMFLGNPPKVVCAQIDAAVDVMCEVL